jgi:Protein of unknown function (DUF3179)
MRAAGSRRWADALRVAALAGALVRCAPPSHHGDGLEPLAKARPGEDMVRYSARQRFGRAFFTPLNDARWVEAARADHVRADDIVLGFQAGGGAWALPWWVMKNHHVANLTLGGKPILITFCENCSSGGAFDPVVDGRRLLFRLEGAYKGTIMLQDEAGGSLWTGFDGTAIHGPHKGRALGQLPLVQCRWDEWLAAQPATLVLSGEGETREGHGSGKDPGEVEANGHIGVSGTLVHLDERLPHNEMVLGVTVGEAARCYPLRRLARNGSVLNDTLAGQPIVVISRPGSLMALAFLSRLEDRSLVLRTRGEELVDEQTGSVWDLSGRAVAGPLAGRQLAYTPSAVHEFYIWASFHPDTEIHGTQTGAPGLE